MSDQRTPAEHVEGFLRSATSPAQRAVADEIRSLRLRAEKAEAERDEARAISETWIVSGGAANMRANDALAACAEMRAALERLHTLAVRCLGHSERVDQLLGPTLSDLAALLSRTDLGAGKVVVEREVVERVPSIAKALRENDDGLTHAETKAVRVLIADLDALLKKGGG